MYLKWNCKAQATYPKLQQIELIGGVSKSSWRDESNTVIGLHIWARFDWENGETMFQFSSDHYCISIKVSLLSLCLTKPNIILMREGRYTLLNTPSIHTTLLHIQLLYCYAMLLTCYSDCCCVFWVWVIYVYCVVAVAIYIWSVGRTSIHTSMC